MIQFILNEPTQFLLMKPQEISDTTFVSKSTLYRLLDKLGYSGLTEFKIDFAAAIQPKNNQNLNLDVDDPIKESDSLREISENLSDLYQETIHEPRNISITGRLLKSLISC